MKLADPGGEIVVITPVSPLGKILLGCVAGDEVQVAESGRGTAYTIVAVR